MCHNRQRIAQPHSWHTSRHQETSKSMHAPGTSAPRCDGGEDGLPSGTSGPIASRDDGAVFLTATKTNKGSVRRGLRVPPQSAGHELVPTQGFGGMNRRKESVPYTLPWYRFVARQTRFARENMATPAPTLGQARTHVPTRARARPPTHAHARPKTTTTVLCWDFWKAQRGCVCGSGWFFFPLLFSLYKRKK